MSVNLIVKLVFELELSALLDPLKPHAFERVCREPGLQRTW